MRKLSYPVGAFRGDSTYTTTTISAAQLRYVHRLRKAMELDMRALLDRFADGAADVHKLSTTDAADLIDRLLALDATPDHWCSRCATMRVAHTDLPPSHVALLRRRKLRMSRQHPVSTGCSYDD